MVTIVNGMEKSEWHVVRWLRASSASIPPSGKGFAYTVKRALSSLRRKNFFFALDFPRTGRLRLPVPNKVLFGILPAKSLPKI